MYQYHKGFRGLVQPHRRFLKRVSDSYREV